MLFLTENIPLCEVMVYRSISKEFLKCFPRCSKINKFFFRRFIDERKTQQNRQERRREKIKKNHESQMTELKKYVQNVSVKLP